MSKPLLFVLSVNPNYAKNKGKSSKFYAKSPCGRGLAWVNPVLGVDGGVDIVGSSSTKN
jgi:hypothetical protein